MQRIVHLAKLPSAADTIFESASYFEENARLPTPAEVRAKSVEIDDYRAKTERPSPVLFEAQQLVVKYGSGITASEGQCLWYFNNFLKSTVPTPEVYGWCRDAGETFIYMQLVQGDTLEHGWPSLSEDEKRALCKQLHDCVASWRELRQDEEPHFVGHIGRQGVEDIIFSDAGDPGAGPFENITSFHDFFARYSCRLDPDVNPRTEFPELAGLTDDRPVVFTHGDLHRSNIVISLAGDGPARVVAIVDWHQSGWYPDQWEYLKAQWTCHPDDREEWVDQWLPQILTPAKDDYWTAWEFTTGSV